MRTWCRGTEAAKLAGNNPATSIPQDLHWGIFVYPFLYPLPTARGLDGPCRPKDTQFGFHADRKMRSGLPRVRSWVADGADGTGLTHRGCLIPREAAR